MTIRVLIADDQALIRAGLVALFTAAPGFEVVGEAADGGQAVAMAARTSPDVILMDIRMPVLDGIAATRQILAAHREPGHEADHDPGREADRDPDHESGTGRAEPPRIVVLTTFDLPEYVYTALGEGASGFLVKDTPPERIISAVRTIAAGDILIAPHITHRLIETYAQHHRATAVGAPQLAALTARETEVLRLVGNGLTNGQIAQRLVLSEATVKTHVKRMMGKLALSSRAQAVVVAYESGLIVPTGSG
ncbi:DNA-binding NarL/FixJ family response regulator [Saccharothrix carnea]|uniref:DNA-binding NarL/FixJ family response regulator n=1 Tax=Saccharothrix carnea TaxID=1280637 RepID=A0A2P8I523_SACCR|nr:response regulator transcription factor [Saccharothrix carnea]PSL53573.1 DNA-binding NarL/FixJ family response regulator [Saccharothrix carnea]